MSLPLSDATLYNARIKVGTLTQGWASLLDSIVSGGIDTSVLDAFVNPVNGANGFLQLNSSGLLPSGLVVYPQDFEMAEDIFTAGHIAVFGIDSNGNPVMNGMSVQDVLGFNSSGYLIFNGNPNDSAGGLLSYNGASGIFAMQSGDYGSLSVGFAASAGSASASGGNADFATVAAGPSNSSSFGGFDLTGNSPFTWSQYQSFGGGINIEQSSQCASSISSSANSFFISWATGEISCTDGSQAIDCTDQSTVKSSLGSILASVQSVTGTLSSGTSTVTVPGGVIPWVQSNNPSITNVGALSLTVSGTTVTIKSSNILDTSPFTLFYWQ